MCTDAGYFLAESFCVSERKSIVCRVCTYMCSCLWEQGGSGRCVLVNTGGEQPGRAGLMTSSRVRERMRACKQACLRQREEAGQLSQRGACHDSETVCERERSTQHSDDQDLGLPLEDFPLQFSPLFPLHLSPPSPPPSPFPPHRPLAVVLPLSASAPGGSSGHAP